jgi:transcriptional regulator with XRE-family HTH domain
MVLQLREVIEADGRSLNQLAKAAGLDSGRLSRFMRGERDINLEAACRLCEVLGIDFVLPRHPLGRPPAREPESPTPPPRRRKK